jgi:hypothetical protein
VLNNAIYTSKITVEVFKALDLEKQNEKEFLTWRMNLKENTGHRYIVKMVLETTNREIIEYKSVFNRIKITENFDYQPAENLRGLLLIERVKGTFF